MTHFRLTTWLRKHLHNCFMKIMHSLSIVNFWNKKHGLVNWLLKNSKIHGWKHIKGEPFLFKKGDV